MSEVQVCFAGATLHLTGSGCLYWPEHRLLCVSDLHLGKSERIARRGGAMLPPYDTRDTLLRLEAEIERFDPEIVVCLGDSFDDLQAAEALEQEAYLRLAKLKAGREWVWIEGNHDAGPVSLSGQRLAIFVKGSLTFRHIAAETPHGEISGHYHPKARLSLKGLSLSRACFVFDQHRMILPAFGTFTGGLYVTDAAISALFEPDARMVLTGPAPTLLPLLRARR